MGSDEHGVRGKRTKSGFESFSSRIKICVWHRDIGFAQAFPLSVLIRAIRGLTLHRWTHRVCGRADYLRCLFRSVYGLRLRYVHSYAPPRRQTTHGVPLPRCDCPGQASQRSFVPHPKELRTRPSRLSLTFVRFLPVNNLGRSLRASLRILITSLQVGP